MDQSRGVDVPYLSWILARNIIMTLPEAVYPYRWTIPRYRVQPSDDDRYHICVKVKHLELKGRPEMWRNWLCLRRKSQEAVLIL